MPELPEVEVTRRSLVAWSQGQTIAAASPGLASLVGGAFQRINRRGKYLLASISDENALLLHLGMTGKFVAQANEAPLPAHCRAWWSHEARRVCFCDPRRFGWVIPGTVAALRPRLDALGPDPWSEGLSVEQLSGVMRGIRQAIKPALLDQSKIAGIGNIQASEALYRAKISPETPAGRLSPSQFAALCEGIHESLRYTFEKIGEVWPPVYVNTGQVENYFLVYDRAGETCPRCQTSIRRIVQAGRSTFYCPRCQAG